MEAALVFVVGIACMLNIVTTNHQHLGLSASFAVAADLPIQFLTADNPADVRSVLLRRYDYIIVGGGAAWCPLAATLSTNYSVLVVERGGSPFGVPEIEEKTQFLTPLDEADEYYSIAQTFETGEGVDGARARVLGGGTAINAGFYSRASAEFVQRMGWDNALVNESYAWVEDALTYTPYPGIPPWQAAIRLALLEVDVRPDNGFTLQHLPGTKISASIFDSNDKRHTAAELLLKYANPNNIVVLLNATTQRILFTPRRYGGRMRGASGVEFVNKDNTVSNKVFLKKKGEVIVCAGAIGSPQVLMLSGIGPAAHLKKFRIPVIADLPEVGLHVRDTPRSDFNFLSRRDLKYSLPVAVGILDDSEVYIETCSLLPTVMCGGALMKFNIAWIFEKVAHPLSEGEVRLVTTDPRDNPSVRFNYYSDKNNSDLKTCVRGSRKLGHLRDSYSLKPFQYKKDDPPPQCFVEHLATMGPELPKDLNNDTAMEKFCRDAVKTIWHYHGGCNIGAVIDENLKVMKVRHVRVVDASTFPTVPGTNPQATVMMLGRYQGVQILRERILVTRAGASNAGSGDDDDSDDAGESPPPQN